MAWKHVNISVQRFINWLVHICFVYISTPRSSGKNGWCNMYANHLPFRAIINAKKLLTKTSGGRVAKKGIKQAAALNAMHFYIPASLCVPNSLQYMHTSFYQRMTNACLWPQLSSWISLATVNHTRNVPDSRAVIH